MATSEKIIVTGASGQLGRLVMAELLKSVPAGNIVGLVRNVAAAKELSALGIELRSADYEQPDSLQTALAGADKVLLISSSEVGKRVLQHRNVINAAKAAGVKLLAYTSILRADTSPMDLAIEHRETEALIKASGIPFVLLRNGWYTENYTASVGAAVEHGAVIGAAKEGRISSAARKDYAAAAAVVLTGDVRDHSGKVYELAGDNSYTLSELAAEIAKQSGKPVSYQNLSQSDYQAALQNIGLPAGLAGVLAESDAKAAEGALYDHSHQLSQLIGRTTTSLSESVAAALKG